MRFGFREVGIREVKEIRSEDKQKEESKNYLKIKPETDITKEECYEFWDKLFGGDAE